ncbi:MAG: endonuclease/exonuclease/phosphatase family protein [Woeseiaceae bacterium]|nr:endonuclease/exonuclease/phosphatase family protein [Woeseiaceae bacterium]
MIARLIILLLLISGCQPELGKQPPLRLTVMTFNAWGAGANQGKSIDATLAVIRTINPDLIGLQEVRREAVPCTSICPPDGPSVAGGIAEALGYYVYEQQQENEALWANAILSKYPVTRSTENDLGVVLAVGDREIALLNIHLTDYPYQPYQALGIPYDDAPLLHSEDELIAAANDARGHALDLLMADLESVKNVDAVFVTGDFNEPSHRDWTQRAAEIGRHPLKVKYPSALRVEEAGFIDTYRTFFADEIAAPGLTWTPTTSADDKDDHHDRIDYVFARAAGVKVESAAVVGEESPDSDIAVSSPWPSDHRAVVATVIIP